MPAKKTTKELGSIPTNWLKSVPTPIFVLNQKGRIVYCNDTFVELTGYERGGLMGARLDRLFGQRNISEILSDLLNLYKGQRFSKKAYDLLRQSGSEIHVEMDLTPIFGDNEDEQIVMHIIGIIKDFKSVE